ncbi:MAG: NAD(P)/FAD-dependent oxidoreductase, partial [Burkholderiales bacterium]|nr:NAD(P)/FAD-dependent oxidoreductase [Anaerolineae bacterium]
VESELQSLGKTSVLRYLNGQLPERLSRAMCIEAGVEGNTPANQISREQRKSLARVLTQLMVPVTGNRGYTYAEVTAGGIPLNDIHLNTMESRLCPELYLCGEICDVDGQIGGFNFQWAWSSGYLAGSSV